MQYNHLVSVQSSSLGVIVGIDVASRFPVGLSLQELLCRVIAPTLHLVQLKLLPLVHGHWSAQDDWSARQIIHRHCLQRWASRQKCKPLCTISKQTWRRRGVPPAPCVSHCTRGKSKYHRWRTPIEDCECHTRSISGNKWNFYFSSY